MVPGFEEEIQNTFLEEATQLLENVEQCFLQLETTPEDPAVIEKIFRLAHNLKGSANAVGFNQLGAFTHELESFLLKFKNREATIKSSTVGLLLRCADYISNAVDGLRVDKAATFDNDELLAAIKSHIANQDTQREQQNPIDHDLNNEAAAPESSESDSQQTENGFHLFSDDNVTSITAPATPSDPHSKGAPNAPKHPTSTTAGSDESIRVSLHRVEKLINFVGELVILQTVLREQSNAKDVSLLRKTVHQLGKVTKEVQEISMSLRMLPLKATFQKMQRIVRDTSAALDKKIKLTMAGEETEIDKTILEKISDPLVHLIRNAADHGIESYHARQTSGKSDTGEISLSAYHQNGSLIIEVRDDGAGLNPQVLRNKAIEKGLIRSDANLSDKEAYHLIFHPGFSTKAVITDVSGRGVGMDVVKTNIEQIQGDIQLETQLGKGTCFKIRLPLTMAIIDAMTIQLDTQRFIIPLSHVYESTKPSAGDIHHVTSMGDVYNLRGERLPLYQLSRLLGQKPSKVKKPFESIAIVIQANGKRFAVLVDDIIGQNQIVIKQLGDENRNLKGFSGSAIMGDGRAALILELPELVDRFHSNQIGPNTLRRHAA